MRATDSGQPLPRRDRATSRAPAQRAAEALRDDLRATADVSGSHPGTRYRRVLAIASSASARASERGTKCFRAPPAQIRPQRDVRGRGSAATGHRRDGLRRPLPAADPSHRQELPQRAQQHAERRRLTIPAARGRIGATEGGHKAIDPRLGTLADFDRFVAAPQRARVSRSRSTSPFSARPTIRTSTEHPEWFRHRPDGTIKYAENPPKKYQDIYPFDFESVDWPALWRRAEAASSRSGSAMASASSASTIRTPSRSASGSGRSPTCARAYPGRDLSRRSVHPAQGHALPGQGWLLAVVHLLHLAQHQGGADRVLHRADARPRCATYMRPNLFANTPDILHEYLQRGGPAGLPCRGWCWRRRWGRTTASTAAIELYENMPLAPRQRGIPSTPEKYQIRPRDFDPSRHPARDDRAGQCHPPRAPCAPVRSTASPSTHRQRAADLLQQGRQPGGRRRRC